MHESARRARLARTVLDWLFPPKCPFCRRLIEMDGMVCPDCLAALPRRGNAAVTVPFADEAVAPFVYDGVVRQALLRMKFGGLSGYGRALGPLLAGTVREHFTGELTLSFVPVSARRKRRRGYDQARLLAQGVGNVLGLSPEPLLCKVRDNPPQSGIVDAETRRANVLGIYRVRDGADVAGRRVLLIDDIITTGATLSECAATLKAAGAAAVYCAAFAHGE